MIGQSLKELRFKNKLSQEKLGEILGVTKGFISLVETNKNQLTSEKLHLIKERFGVDLTKKEDTSCLILSGIISIPLFNNIEASAGNGRYIETETPDDYICFSKKYLREYVNSCEQLSIIQANGDSMQPTIADKTWLLVDHSQTELKKPGIYVIRLADELYVKRIQKIPPEKIIRVKSDNPSWESFDIPYENFTDFQIIGKVCLKIDNRFE